MTAKPEWVRCADRAKEVLNKANNQDGDLKQELLNEAYAWMRLSDIYREGQKV